MATTIEEKLAELKREIERQDAEWERVKQRLLALGDVQLVVPERLLEEIDDATRVRAPAALIVPFIRA